MLNEIGKEKSVIKVIDFIRESTRIAPKTSSESIDTLNYKEISGALIINREYQRNFIQTIESASAYIESIFLGLIIPEIQVFEDYRTGEREIVDGQQRVLSLLKFYRGEYSLKGLKELPQLNGFYYKDLPNDIKNIVKNFQVNIRTFTSKDEMYKYLIFERLNTGTKKLNSQEVRNCVYRGNAIEMIKNMAEMDEVIELLLKVRNERYQRVEIVLNLMALTRFYTDEETREFIRTDKMKERLNKYLELLKDFDLAELEKEKDRFIEIARFINKHFDIKEILSEMYQGRPNYPVGKTICETLYTALSRYNLNEVDSCMDIIRDDIYEVFLSCEYREMIGSSYGKSLRAISERCHLIKRLIDKGLKEVKLGYSS